LKRKFSFSYFRENFVQNFFRFSRKKPYEKLQKFSRKFLRKFSFRFRERFREKSRFRESFRENFPFGKRIRIQEPPECVSRSETLVENFCENFRENENFPNNFRENENFRKNIHKSKFREK
jgi:hypothetical protein